MGRQHTTWISDETWDRLQNIKGDSVSNRIANAVEQADPDREMIIKAEMRRLERLVDAMKSINKLVMTPTTVMNPHEILGRIEGTLDAVEFCWRD